MNERPAFVASVFALILATLCCPLSLAVTCNVSRVGGTAEAVLDRASLDDGSVVTSLTELRTRTVVFSDRFSTRVCTDFTVRPGNYSIRFKHEYSSDVIEVEMAPGHHYALRWTFEKTWVEDSDTGEFVAVVER